MNIQLAVVGGRDFRDYKKLSAAIDSIRAECVVDRIISGGARGADSLAEKYARERNIPITVFRPDWEREGKKAGLLRNKDIIEASGWVLAFWDGESRGTQHTITIAKKSMKRVVVYSY